MMSEATIRRLSVLALLALATLFPGVRAASQENPFGAPQTPAVPPTTAADEKMRPGAEKTPPEQEEKDPFVRAVLNLTPTTPTEWIQDAKTLMDLKRPELARTYFKAFLDLQLDQSALAAVHNRFGSALFLRLTNQPDLQPEGLAAANAVMEAADQENRREDRLTALVDGLGGDPQSAAYRAAVAELVRAGAPAVPFMIVSLADPAAEPRHPGLRAALTTMGEVADRPLAAALESGDARLRVEILRILGRRKSRQAVPRMLVLAIAPGEDEAVRAAAQQALQETLGGVPSADVATRFLQRQFDEFLAGRLPGAVDGAGNIEEWAWDAPQGRPAVRALPAADAVFEATARAARHVHTIAPEKVEYRRWFLATALELAKRNVGYDRPLSSEADSIVQQAVAAGPDELEELLAWCLDKRLLGAAIATIEILGKVGSSQLLESADGKPRMLTSALRSPHARVRFAAARSIVGFDPQRSYPGCSYLPEVLGHFSVSSGSRRVLVGDPRAERARTLAGLFTQLGFSVVTTVGGRQVVLEAFNSPDICFALVGDAIEAPRLQELVQILRRDARTADLPIGVLFREENGEQVKQFAASDPLTIPFAYPQDAADVAADTKQLLMAAGRRELSMDERTYHATFALDTLARFAEMSDKYGFYDVLRQEPQMLQALGNSPLAAKAARVLGLLGSPNAQQSLVEYAGLQARALADRQAAAEAFKVAVARRGLLLTSAELSRQIQRQQASETLDQASQQILASIMDTIKAPPRKKTSALDER
ncbi:MAG: hypothetical protein FJ276_09585 [Planctomycetes bacterium]|nr:hypothetical protein [Planctomycetota bacterium]